MKPISIVAAVAAATICSSVSASAAPSGPPKRPAPQCVVSQTSTKVDLSGLEPTTVLSGLTPGDSVCYKAGRAVKTVTVGETGVVSSEIVNKRGQARAISYYVVTPGPELVG